MSGKKYHLDKGIVMKYTITKKIFLFIAVFALHAFLFAAIPDWLVDLEKAFPSDQYIRVIGEGYTEDVAKRNALTELGAYFSQTVESVTKAHLEMHNGAQGNTTNRSIQKDVRVSSKVNLFAVHYTQCFKAKKSNAYAVCAYIVKNKAWDILRQKLSVLEVSLKQCISSANKEAEPFRKICILTDMKDVGTEFLDLYGMALVVYPEKCENLESSVIQYAEAERKLTELKHIAQFHVSVSDDNSIRIQSAIEDKLTKSGFTISKNTGTYRLSAVTVCVVQESNGIFFCYPELNIVITRGSETVFSYEGRTGKLAAYDRNALERLSFSRLENLIEEMRF